MPPSKEFCQQVRHLLKEKRYADALELCQRELESFPADVFLNLAVASAYSAVEQFQQSIVFCQKVLSIDSFNVQAFNGLFCALEKLRKPLEASESLEPLKKHFRESQKPEDHFALVQKQIDVLKKASKWEALRDLLSIHLNDSLVSKLYKDSAAENKTIALMLELESCHEKIHQKNLRHVQLNFPKSSQELKDAECQLYENSPVPIAIHQIIAQFPPEEHKKKLDIRVLKLHSKLVLWLGDALAYDLKKDKKERFVALLKESLRFLHLHDSLSSTELKKAYADAFLSELLPSFEDISSALQKYSQDCSAMSYISDSLKHLRLNDHAAFFSSLSSLKQVYSTACSRFNQKSFVVDALLSVFEAVNLFFSRSYADAFELLKPIYADVLPKLNLVELNLIMFRLLNKQSLFHDGLEFCQSVDPDALQEPVCEQKAWFNFCLGNFSEALAILQRISSSETYFSLYLKGRIAYSLGNVLDAFDFYLGSVKLNPLFAPSFAYLGFYYFDMDDFERAKKCLMKSIELDLEDAEPTLEKLCKILFTQQNYPQAAAVLKIHLKAFPRSSLSLKMLSICQIKCDDLEGCIATLLQYLRMSFRDFESWETLGECYFKVGRFSAALKAFLHALDFEPTLAVSRFFAGLIYDKMGKHAQAITYFSGLLGDRLVGPSAFKHLLDCAVDLFSESVDKRCFGMAFDHLQSVLLLVKEAIGCSSACSSYYGLWKFFGLVFFFSGKFSKLSLKPVILTLFSSLFVADASVNMEWSEHDFAVYSLKRAIDCTSCRQFQAVLFGLLGNISNDEKSLQKAILLDKSNISYWNSLGIFYLKNKRWGDSQHCFLKSLQIENKSAITWIYLGFLYLQCSKKDSGLAVRAFEEAQKISSTLILGWIGLYLATNSLEYLLHAIDVCEIVIPEMLFLTGKFCFTEKYFKSNSARDLVDALVSFQQYSLLFPRSPECWNFMGLIAEAQGHTQLASEYFSEAFACCSQAPSLDASAHKTILFNKARCYVSLGLHSSALETLHSIGAPESFSSLYEKFVYAVALFHVDQSKSMSFFQEIFEKSAENTELMLYFVKVLFSATSLPNRLDLATNLLLSVVQNKPNHSQAIKTLLLVSLNAKTLDESLIQSCISQLKLTSISQHQIHFDISCFLIKVFQILGRHEEIAKIRQTVLLLNPFNEACVGSFDVYFAANTFVSQASVLAVLKNDFAAENNLRLQTENNKTLQASLLLDIMNFEIWKVFFINHIKTASIANNHFWNGFRFIDSDWVDLLYAAIHEQPCAKIVELCKTKKDYRWNQLALQMYFLMFSHETQIREAKSILQAIEGILSPESILEISYQLYCKGFHVPKILKKSIHPLYKIFFDSDHSSSVKMISTFAKNNGGQTSTTLLMQALLNFYYLKNHEAAAKSVTKILSVEPRHKTAALLAEIINKSKM